MDYATQGDAFGYVERQKHSSIDDWMEYTSLVEQFKNDQSDLRIRTAENALCLYDKLHKYLMFSVYPNLTIDVVERHKVIAKFLDEFPDWIEEAARRFFQSKHEGQHPKIEFEEARDGTRSAVICDVKVNSITHKFRIKTNHNAGENNRATRFNLNLIELFCYKLLEEIRVGPQILFIPNCVSSKSIIYLASQWMPMFQPFNSIENVESTEVSRAVVQVHFLADFLSLGDMHENNFGLHGTSNPTIVDFMTSKYRDPKHKFLHENNVIRSIRARSILNRCDSTARLQIAKEAIEKWQIIDKLEETLKTMDEEMMNFDGRNLYFDKTTKDLDELGKK